MGYEKKLSIFAGYLKSRHGSGVVASRYGTVPLLKVLYRRRSPSTTRQWLGSLPSSAIC